MTTFGIPRALSKKQAAPPVSKFAASTIRRRVMQRLQIAQSRRPLRRRSLLISRHSHYSTIGLRYKFRDGPRVTPKRQRAARVLRQARARANSTFAPPACSPHLDAILGQSV